MQVKISSQTNFGRVKVGQQEEGKSWWQPFESQTPCSRRTKQRKRSFLSHLINTAYSKYENTPNRTNLE
ncbi:hypothetical protein ABKN59_007545 [Abortiporus biennis]